jgi:hypothetical protein
MGAAMLERASPAQLRQVLKIANLFTKMGIGFVPVLVANAAEFDVLAKQSIEKLAELEQAAESAEKGQNNG